MAAPSIKAIGGGTDILWWRLASHLEESFPFVEILIWKWALGTEESPESQPCAYKLTDGFARHFTVWLYKNGVCHKLKCRLLSLEKWILLLLFAKELRLCLSFISKGCWGRASSGVCKMILLKQLQFALKRSASMNLTDIFRRGIWVLSIFSTWHITYWSVFFCIQQLVMACEVLQHLTLLWSHTGAECWSRLYTDRNSAGY